MAHITDIEVSLDEAQESQLRAQGFSKINVDLNKGAQRNYIYLWYKKGSCPAVTGIQLTFIDQMSEGLSKAGYYKINKNLNAGTGGDIIYLWYCKGSSQFNIPIVDLDVTVDAEHEAEQFKNGWETPACDLNWMAKGNWIYLWFNRENTTYICDITASSGFEGDSDLLNDGYIRLDEDTNRGGGGAYVFVWYRLTTHTKMAIRDLQVSTSDADYQAFQSQGYTPVNQDLNQGTGGNPVFLWYKKDNCGKTPIMNVTVIANAAAKPVYERAGIEVIDKNLNTGNRGDVLYLCFKSQ